MDSAAHWTFNQTCCRQYKLQGEGTWDCLDSDTSEFSEEAERGMRDFRNEKKNANPVCQT